MSTLYDTLVHTKNPANVIQYSTITNARNQQCSVIELQNGDWLCVWSYYFDAITDASNSEIWARKSTNKGVSWGNAYQIIPIAGGTGGLRHPSLYQKADGDIVMLVGLEATDHLSAQIMQYISDDNGDTFTVVGSIYATSDYESPDYITLASNRIFKTQTGRLLFPFHIPTTDAHYSNTGIMVSRVIYSDNEGTDWSVSATIMGVSTPALEQLLAEPCIVQLPNATLLCTMRTRSGYVRISTSTDNGATWSNPPTKSATLALSNSMHSTAYVNGKLIAIGNRVEGATINGVGARIHQDLWKSEDLGSTWTFVKNITDKSGVYVFAEPIIKEKASSIIVFYDQYPPSGAEQDLIFQEVNFSEF